MHTVRGCNNNIPVDEVIEILIRMDGRIRGKEQMQVL